MNADCLQRCLDHLDAAEDALLADGDWAAAAHLSLLIERVRANHGLPERPLNLAEFALWSPPRRPLG